MRTHCFHNMMNQGLQVRLLVLLSFNMLLILGCEPSSLSQSGSSQSSSMHNQNDQNDHTATQDVRSSSEGNQATEIATSPRPALEENLFTLALELVDQGSTNHTVRLSYHRRELQTAPRTAEIFIEYPEELTVAQVTKLEATEQAEKDLIVQYPSPGRIRMIWMSIGNLNTLESGPLAEIKFQGRPSTRSAVHILSLPDHPWFAPAAANEGVLISDPLLFVSE